MFYMIWVSGRRQVPGYMIYTPGTDQIIIRDLCLSGKTVPGLYDLNIADRSDFPIHDLCLSGQTHRPWCTWFTRTESD